MQLQRKPSYRTRKKLLSKILRSICQHEDELFAAVENDLGISSNIYSRNCKDAATMEGSSGIQGQLECGALVQEVTALYQQLLTCEKKEKNLSIVNSTMMSEDGSVGTIRSVAKGNSKMSYHAVNSFPNYNGLNLTGSSPMLQSSNYRKEGRTSDKCDGKEFETMPSHVSSPSASTSSSSLSSRCFNMGCGAMDSPNVRILLGPWQHPLFLLLQPLLYAIAEGRMCIVRTGDNDSRNCTRVLEEVLRDAFMDNRIGRKYGKCYRITAGHNSYVCRSLRCLTLGGRADVTSCSTRAAENSDPYVNLRLGRKVPVIVDRNMSSMELYRTARRIVEDKLKHDGKTFYGPDYVIVHENVADDFISTLRTILMNSSHDVDDYDVNNVRKNKKYTNPNQFRKLMVGVREFQNLIRKNNSDTYKQALYGLDDRDCVELNENNFPRLVIARNPPLHSRLMMQEVFGPVLPIVTACSMKEAAQIARRVSKATAQEYSRPMAIYVYSNKREVVDRIVGSVIGTVSAGDNEGFYLAKNAFLSSSTSDVEETCDRGKYESDGLDCDQNDSPLDTSFDSPLEWSFEVDVANDEIAEASLSTESRSVILTQLLSFMDVNIENDLNTTCSFIATLMMLAVYRGKTPPLMLCTFLFVIYQASVQGGKTKVSSVNS